MDGIGFRPVVAPMPKDYFELEWFIGNRLRTAKLDGKGYAGIGGCFAFTTWLDAEKIATSLSARLPQPASADELGRIFQALDADLRYPVHLGIVFRDGGWRNLSDGSLSSFAKELGVPDASGDATCLSALPNRRFFTYAQSQEMPNIFLEYPDADGLTQHPVLKLEDCFELDGRRFGLLKFHLVCYQHKAFLKFAGHRAPVIHDAAFLERLARHFQSVKTMVAVGCYRSYDGWRTSDGSGIDGLGDLEWCRRFTNYDTINYSIVVANAGRLWSQDAAHALLVELPSIPQDAQGGDMPRAFDKD